MMDGDARGGAALSVKYITVKQIMFASTGESLKDFEVFHPDRMASRILDMGDVMSLIEQAERTIDKGQAERMAQKFADQEDFTLERSEEHTSELQSRGQLVCRLLL